jgi:CDP-paratose synthetase
VLSQLKLNVPEIKLTLGEQERDFIYIDDVVAAYLFALDKATGLVSFNEFDVGTGQLLTVKYFLQNLKKIYEASFGLTDTKLVFGAIPYREGEMMTVEVNNQKLLDLGWKPRTKLKDGLISIIKESV